MSENFEKTITFSPAFDKRHTDPGKNYGIHCVELRFVLKGEKGATQFLLFTSWHLPEVTEELMMKDTSRSLFNPLPADLGYHSYIPIYEDQTKRDSCDILNDCPNGCFYDGSGLNAQRVYERLLREGHEGVWAALEEQYHHMFDDLDINVINAAKNKQ